MSHIDEIIQDAKQWVGSMEIPQNQGFVNPVLQSKMNALGFQKGQSWCSYFVEMVMRDVYMTSRWLSTIKKYCSPSTQQMWQNFAESPEYHVSQTPKLGSIVVWQDGNEFQGHTGIVVSIVDGVFSSVEGNSNNTGSTNGDRVALNTHKLIFTNTGFHLKGFIWMPKDEINSTVQDFKAGI